MERDLIFLPIAAQVMLTLLLFIRLGQVKSRASSLNQVDESLGAGQGRLVGADSGLGIYRHTPGACRHPSGHQCSALAAQGFQYRSAAPDTDDLAESTHASWFVKL